MGPMVRTAGQTLFAHVVSRPDEQLELDVAALLVAEWDYQDLDVAHYLRVLDGFADMARDELADGGADTPFSVVRALNNTLFGVLGFRGNDDDYYNPRNSFLHEVLDSRTGIPITLSVTYMEVARRLGVSVRGVSFPGHFLIRYDEGDDTMILDPFRMGLSLDEDTLRELHRSVAGAEARFGPELLEPASKREILSRMLANLAGIYGRSGDVFRSLEVLERMAILEPDDRRILRELERLRRRANLLN
jgi:regulator of sirC expression with transglutaminase-like and TPR domain